SKTACNLVPSTAGTVRDPAGPRSPASSRTGTAAKKRNRRAEYRSTPSGAILPLRSWSVHLDTADVEKLHHHHDEQEREHGEGNPRSLAQKTGADADLIGIGRKQLRRVGRAAAGQYIDKLEVRECLDYRE